MYNFSKLLKKSWANKLFVCLPLFVIQTPSSPFVIQSEAKNLVYIHVYVPEILRFALDDKLCYKEDKKLKTHHSKLITQNSQLNTHNSNSPCFTGIFPNQFSLSQFTGPSGMSGVPPSRKFTKRPLNRL